MPIGARTWKSSATTIASLFVLSANTLLRPIGDELDKLTRQLAAEPFISQAFWSPSTTD